MNNRVLVIGGNHYNPLGVIEALGQKGVLSDVIIMGNCKKSFVLKSKYIARSWICHAADDVITTIIANFTDTKNKAVTIACSDDAACLLDEHNGELSGILYLPGTKPQGSLNSWQDKQKMTDTAENLGMTIPKTWVVCNKMIPPEIEYPCITKPITSVKFGKTDFSICNNNEELTDFIKNKSHSNSIQVQKLVDKDFEYQLMGCSLNAGETIIIPGDTYIKKVMGFTNGAFMKYHKNIVCEKPKIIQLCHEFIRKTGYSGLFSVEYMRGVDGKDYFLEMNFRNDGNCAVVTAAGTNLPYIWYLYNTGGDYQAEIEESMVKETYSVPEDAYFASMLRGDVSFKEWYLNMKKIGGGITYFKSDTKPFWALIWLQKETLLKAALIGVLRKLGLRK